MRRTLSFAERAIPVKRSDEELGRKATTALAWAIAALAVYAFLYTIASIVRLYTPIMFWDHWLVLDFLRPGQLTLAHLWSLHNEHRYLIGRLLSLADIVLFRGQGVSLYLEIFAFQTVHLLIFVWIVRRFTHFSRPLLISVLAFLLYCMFSPLQLENFVWSFQTGFVLAGCAAAACFLFACWYATLPAERLRRRNFALAGCIFLAWVSEASLANGVLVWPLLVFMALALGFRKRDLLMIFGNGVLAVALYMPGYHTPPLSANPLDSIHHPVEVLKFVVTYLASSWDPNGPSASNFPSPAESLTMLAMAIAVLGALACLRNWKRPSPLRAFLYADMLFVLGTAFLTALGRLNFGYAEAASSRYQIFALAFWASLAILGATYLNEMKAGWRAMAAAQIGVLAILLGTPYRYSGIEHLFANRKNELFAGYEDLVLGHLHSPSIDKLFSLPKRLPGYLAILREYHAEPSLGMPELLPADMNMDSYHVAPASACQGYIEHTAFDTQKGYGVAGGWTWDNEDHRPPQRMLVASVATGSIAGRNWLLISRPDVSKIPGINSNMTGWNVSFHANGDGPYQVFAILGHNHLVCRIGKPFTLHK
ncbi:MAG: hypothetical protein ACRD45_10415 [Bryobacteraceae bacterium]